MFKIFVPLKRILISHSLHSSIPKQYVFFLHCTCVDLTPLMSQHLHEIVRGDNKHGDDHTVKDRGDGG